MALFDDVMHGLGNDGMATIGRSLGVDHDTAATALSAAVPMLIAALSRNASHSDGASALLGAIERDHDGSIFEQVTKALSGGHAVQDGEAILAHALGGTQRDSAAQAIGRATGMDTQKALQLLAMAAPFVLGAIGRAKRQKRFEPGDLGSYLSHERSALHGRSAGAMDMLSQILDADHDGSPLDEIAKMGSELMRAFRA